MKYLDKRAVSSLGSYSYSMDTDTQSTSNEIEKCHLQQKMSLHLALAVDKRIDFAFVFATRFHRILSFIVMLILILFHH